MLTCVGELDQVQIL